MSIEIIGQKKYDYQDLVVLEQILRFWNNSVICKNEQIGGEDATLCVQFGDSQQKIELQVKGAERNTDALSPTTLLNYLAHFPKLSDKNSLFERVINDNKTLCLIICAQRATDECAPIVGLKNWDGKLNANDTGIGTLAKTLQSKLKDYKTKNADSPTEVRRENAMRALGAKLSIAQLRSALPRVIALENWDEEYVISSITSRLTKAHSIPLDIVDDVINRLVAAIKKSKGKDEDVVPELSEILRNATSPSVRPFDYVARGNEEQLELILSQDRILLLSGSPRCGKSDTARWIAAQYETQGFRIETCYSVEEADRKINNYSNIQSIVVLDDPLGSGLSESELLPRNYRALCRLTGQIPMNRRLIVAQSQEGLLASANVSSIDEVCTSGKAWHNLAIYPDTFLSLVWSANSLKYSVPQLVEQIVSDGIATGTLSLGPGTLSHLAANTHSLPSQANLEDIHAFAAQSAQDFAMSLCATIDSKRIVRALAVGSTARERASTREIAFMLGSGDEPKLPEFPGMIHSWGSIDIGTPKLPSYDTEPTLSHSEKNEVAKLQQHRIVSNQPTFLRFSHPFYRDAARAAVSRFVAIEREEILALLRRGLLCYSPESSAAAARNLRWIYKDLGSSLDLEKEIVEVAELGLSWYFPITRDLCYEFLISLAESVPLLYGKKIGDWVNNILSAGVNDLVYDRGICFLPEGMAQSYDPIAEFKMRSKKDLSASIKALQEGAQIPSGKEAIDLLDHFEHNPEELDILCVNRLLSLEEGIMRASVAATWLSVERANDDDVMLRISLDSHPKVASKAIQMFLKKWEQYSNDRQHQLFKAMEPWCERPETAAAVLRELIKHFYREKDFGETKSINAQLWDIFARLFERAARRFPISFWVSDSRLYSVCTDALCNLPESTAKAISFAWADMLNRLVSASRLPSDYELGVVASVISSPSLKSIVRVQILERLLSIPSTGTSMVFIAELATYWEELTIEEKSLAKSQLALNKDDLVWLQAAVLTRTNVPTELLEIILGSSENVFVLPEDLVNDMPADLLAACIRVYRGDPDPLWRLGIHHSKSIILRRMVRYIATCPEHALFAECVDELISYDEDGLMEVIRTLQNDGRAMVFNQLIDTKVGVTGEWHQAAVDYLLGTAPDPISLKHMQNKMLSVVSAVLESVSDIFHWTTHPKTRELLLSNVENDLNAILYSKKFLELNNSDAATAKRGFSNLLIHMEENAPVLHDTYSTVQNLARKVRAQKEVLEMLEDSRKKILNAYFSEQEFHRQRIQKRIILTNWIGP